MLGSNIASRIENICTNRNIPFHCIFELTYRCNLSCLHCYAPKDTDDELSLGEIASILDQLSKIGTFHLVFTGGEILMRSDFFDVASLAKSKGFLISLMTNGTLITSEIADRIARIRPTGIEISLYAACKEIHDHITNVEGSFKQTIDAIKYLVQRRLRVTTKTVILKCNAGEFKGIEAISRSLGATPKINFGVIPCKDGSLHPLRHELSFEEVLQYSLKEKLIDGLPRTYKEPKEILECKAGKSVCSISPEGDVTPCLLMPVKLGNLRDSQFEEIWYRSSNEILQKLRNGDIYNGSDCSKCQNLAFCYRCPGIAYVETGDLFGKSPTACRYARWRKKIHDMDL